MITADDPVLTEARRSLAARTPAALPPALAASVERHHGNLAALVVSMRAAGLDERAVEGAVRTLVASYEIELLAALRTMMETPDAP